MDSTVVLAIAFTAVVAVALALDLGVFHRDAHIVPAGEALRWTVVWVAIAVAMGIAILATRGSTQAIQYATGYVVEYSLSIDNVFVFGLVFAAFRIPRELQHRVLFWGVIGALAMRLVMILLGTALIERFAWLLVVFGAFLVATGLRMLMHRAEAGAHPERSFLVRLATRHLRVTPELQGQRFLVRSAAGLAVTPLLLSLIAIEASDLVFAIDSIPAIFGVTTDPFLILASNAAAILGLRSLYFLLADATARFRMLSTGLALVLLFIGGKLVLGPWIHVDPVASLSVVILIIGGSIAASIVILPTRRHPHDVPLVADLR
jgi:tellurite resistance protein TerC